MIEHQWKGFSRTMRQFMFRVIILAHRRFKKLLISKQGPSLTIANYGMDKL